MQDAITSLKQMRTELPKGHTRTLSNAQLQEVFFHQNQIQKLLL